MIGGALRREVAHLLARALRADNAVFAALQTIAAQLLVLALNMGTGIITSRMLGPEGRGMFAAATLWPQLLVTVCFVGVPAGIIYHIRRAPQASGNIFAAAGVFAAGLSCVGMVAGWIAAPLVMTNYPPQAVQLAWMCIAATGPYVVLTMMRQMMVAQNYFADFNISNMLPPLLYLLALLAMWTSVGVTVEGSSLALVGSVSITAAWLCWRARRLDRPSTDNLAFWLGRLLSYSARGAAAGFLAGISTYMDRLVLVAVLSPSGLGLYAVAYSLSRLLVVLQTVASSVVFSKLAGRSLDEAKRLHDHAFRFMFYAVLGVVSIALALSREVVILLYGEHFADAALIFDILLLEAGLICIAEICVQLFYACGRPGYVSLSHAAGLAITATGLALLVPPFGAPGAAVAMVVAAAARLLILLAGIRGRLGLPVPRLSPRLSDLAYLRSRFQG